MGQRNLHCFSNPMMNFGTDREYQCFLHPGSSYPSGSRNGNYASSHNIPTNLSQVPLDNAMFYGGAILYNCLPQGPQHLHHPTNMDRGVPIPSNFYSPYMNPSSTSSAMVHGPLNPGCSDQFPLSSRGGAPGASIDDYGSNNVFMAGARGLNSHPWQLVGSPWLDQLSSTSGNAGTSYNGAPVFPYTHVSAENGGSLEIGNRHMQGYNERSSRSSRFSPQPAQIHPQYQNPHQPASPSRVRSINICVRPENLHAMNNSSHVDVVPSLDGEVVGLRYTGAIPQSGMRMYQSSQTEGVVPEATLRSYISTHMRYLPEDEVVILSAPGFHEVGQASGFHEVGHLNDHNQDMRMYIDDMTYEELLALEDRIGSVRTGLSEREILKYLKIKTFASSTTSINPAFVEHEDRKDELCVICQVDYQNEEKVGSLDCGHEYHACCITKWLQLKNVCPICKSPAVKTEGNDT